MRWMWLMMGLGGCGTTTCDLPAYEDLDGDGFGTVAVLVCEGAEGVANAAGDCDDYRAEINPEAEEVCDGIDNNCNEEADEDLDEMTVFVDRDDDGYGDDSATEQSCGVPSGYVEQGGDCDDGRPGVNPGATEIPGDGIDQDCDTRD